MKKNALLLLLILIGFSGFAQIVNIPDANFKACLVATPNLDTNGDGEVQVSEAQSFAGTINCEVLGINDATGIEAFTVLVNGVVLSGNPITTINLSNSPGLKFFVCEGCNLNSINLTGLDLLEILFIQFNDLTSFDTTQLPALRELIIGYNPLTSLTIGNSNLYFLNIDSTGLTSVDLSGLPLLDQFSAQQTDILQIDFSNNPNLERLSLYQASLENLDISTNLAVNNLSFEQAPNLTTLDLSSNTSLEVLRLSGSPVLSELTLASGNNSAITQMDVSFCDVLFCVEVDTTIDISNPPVGWNLGSGTSLSYDCSVASPPINIPDANFKACLLADPNINTNGDNEIQLAEANGFTGSIICENLGIVTLTGLEEFLNVSQLRLANNLIVNIDIGNNTQLEYVTVLGNPTISLDTSTNTLLDNLNIIGTEIQNLNLSNNNLLRRLVAQTSDLNNVDFSSNLLLEIINVRATNVTSLDVSMLPELITLSFNDNGIPSIDVTNNPNLAYLTCSGNEITTLDLSNNPNLIEVFVSFNNLDSIDISNGNNALITSFNATNNPNLSCIQVDGSIDLNNPPAGWEKDATANYSYDCMFLGIEEVEISQISMYPNPTSDVVIISSEMPIEEVNLYNIHGSLLFQTKETSVSLEAISSGIYFMSLVTEEGVTVTKKIIKK